MSDSEITIYNVDDFIRERKQKGAKRIIWGKNGVRHLRKFARIIYHDNGFRLPHSFPSGDLFMGIKHVKRVS